MLWHGAIMFIAAFFAGVINSIAGGGMLLVFPVMIWLGVDPKIANATCTVALWPGLFAGLFGYRREMNDSSIDSHAPRGDQRRRRRSPAHGC